MLGTAPLPVLDMTKKRSQSSAIRIVKRDSRSVKLVRFSPPFSTLRIFTTRVRVATLQVLLLFFQRLGVGGTAERIVSALHTVLSEQADEDADLENCKSSMRHVGKMEKDVDSACSKGTNCKQESSILAILAHFVILFSPCS
jgi:regulator of Ty1 transposition protein 103